jgi:cell division protein FtsQ
MDGGGRLDQPLRQSGPKTAGTLGAGSKRPHWLAAGRALAAMLRRLASWIPYRLPSATADAKTLRFVPRPGLGIGAFVLLLAATLSYGAAAGGHIGAIVEALKDARDAVANASGFRIAAVSLSGAKEVSREDILAAAGVSARASLLFLDANAARARLLANPWIADATVLKLYPDRLQITVTERQAFALWQWEGHVKVIAVDGTVLEEPFVEKRYFGLPLVVGRGAAQHAKDFLALMDRYPDIRSVLRAGVLVAERRWNLRLKNGIDVRLPETGVEAALDRLVALDREKKLLSRDIVAVDLRLPDRVTVRLSNAAAQVRQDAFKDKRKKKAGDA